LFVPDVVLGLLPREEELALEFARLLAPDEEEDEIWSCFRFEAAGLSPNVRKVLSSISVLLL